jgi:hypothetical protein
MAGAKMIKTGLEKAIEKTASLQSVANELKVGLKPSPPKVDRWKVASEQFNESQRVAGIQTRAERRAETLNRNKERWSNTYTKRTTPSGEATTASPPIAENVQAQAESAANFIAYHNDGKFSWGQTGKNVWDNISSQGWTPYLKSGAMWAGGMGAFGGISEWSQGGSAWEGVKSGAFRGLVLGAGIQGVKVAPWKNYSGQKLYDSGIEISKQVKALMKTKPAERLANGMVTNRVV